MPKASINNEQWLHMSMNIQQSEKRKNIVKHALVYYEISFKMTTWVTIQWNMSSYMMTKTIRKNIKRKLINKKIYYKMLRKDESIN